MMATINTPALLAPTEHVQHFICYFWRYNNPVNTFFHMSCQDFSPKKNDDDDDGKMEGKKCLA